MFVVNNNKQSDTTKEEILTVVTKDNFATPQTHLKRNWLTKIDLNNMKSWPTEKILSYCVILSSYKKDLLILFVLTMQ